MTTTHYTERDGATLAYELHGEGPPVLLVQGLGLPGTVWRERARDIAEMGYQVIVPDNRGTGHSQRGGGPYLMSMLADDARAVLDAVTPEPAIVAGVSLGGMISQRLALRHRDRVRGLVLGATWCGLPHGKIPPPQMVALLVKVATAQRGGDADAALALLAHPDNTQTMLELFRLWDARLTVTPTPPATVLSQLFAACLHSSGFELPGLDIPVEVVVGDSDRLIPPANSRVIADRLRHANLTVVPRAGHSLINERPHVLPDAITRLAARLT